MPRHVYLFSGASAVGKTSALKALLPLLEHCVKTPGVHVIDCPVDYGENDRILNDELRARSLAV